MRLSPMHRANRSRFANAVAAVALAAGTLAIAPAATVSGAGGYEGLVSWGAAASSGLGNGTTGTSTPTAVTGLGPVLAVAGGQDYGFAILANGQTWAWGQNDSGQLGIGNAINDQPPTPITAQGLPALRSVAGLFAHSIGVGTDGSLWTWGANYAGQLGDGTLGDEPSPILIPAPSPGLTWTAADVGRQHTIALASDGTVWTWGDNTFGQLGGNPDNPSRPWKVPTLTNIVAVAAGVWSNVALDSSGTVWTWGLNNLGQLGDGGPIGFTERDVPGAVSGLPPIGAISAGDGFVLAEASGDGSLWAWGDGRDGELGDGGTSSTSVPERILAAGQVTRIAAGGHHSMALTPDGTVLAWGSGGGLISPNDSGELLVPTVVGMPGGAPAFEISAGENALFALIADTIKPGVIGVPDGPPSASGWYNAKVTITWVVSDPAPSSGGPTVPPVTTAKTDGANVLYTSAPSCDGAQNCATGSLSLSIDKSPPIGGLQINGGAVASKNPTVALDTTATDAVSGMSLMRISNTPPTGKNLAAKWELPYSPSVAAWKLDNAAVDGPKTVSIQWGDVAGNWSAVVTKSIFVDRIKPVVGTPATYPNVFGGQIDVAGGIPVYTILDPGSDAAPSSGIVEYDVTSSAGVTTAQQGVQSINEVLQAGSGSETESVVDAAGNISKPSKETFKLQAIQDGNTQVTYTGGGWSVVTDAAAWGNKRHTSSHVGATATLTFTTTANSVIDWVAPTGPGGGIVDVTLQGFAPTTVDLSSPTSVRKLVMGYVVAAAGPQTLTLKLRAGTGTIDVDGFTLLTHP